MDMKTRGNASL
uniref:Uncharacterized protein n=1 Tax=Rhizophora mucronata TaxID=61149 RepID=A0A2P2P4A8_RHIMU